MKDRRHPRRAARTALAAAVLGTALAGCGAGESAPSDALQPVGSHHHLCIDSLFHGRVRSAFTEGLDTLANRGPAPVRITGARWPTTGNLRADSIRVFQRQPGDRFAMIGLWDGLPQDALTGSERRAWQRSQPLTGAVLGRTDATQHYLVVTIGVTGTHGTGGPLTVRYTDADGRAGTATSLVLLRVGPGCTGR